MGASTVVAKDSLLLLMEFAFARVRHAGYLQLTTLVPFSRVSPVLSMTFGGTYRCKS